MASLEIDLDEVTKRAFARLGELEPLIQKQAQRALDESAASILQRLRETFLQEQDPSGTPWIPSKAGLKRKAKGDGQTLFDTGTLFRSIQLATDLATKEERVIRTDVPYATYLQNHKTVPRVFLAIGQEHIDTMEEIFQFRMKQTFRVDL